MNDVLQDFQKVYPKRKCHFLPVQDEIYQLRTVDS